MANTVSASADPVPRQPQKEAEHMDRRPKAAQGFEAAFDAYGPMVYRLAMVYLGSKADAEDVSQEAFIRLLYKSPKFADGEHEKRWLLRVAVYGLYDLFGCQCIFFCGRAQAVKQFWQFGVRIQLF